MRTALAYPLANAKVIEAFALRLALRTLEMQP